MTSAGLLVVTNPLKLGWLLHLIQQQVRRTLYIQLFPGWHLIPEYSSTTSPSSSDTQQPQCKYVAQLGTLISDIYTQASALCCQLDVRVLLTLSKAAWTGSSQLPSKPPSRQVDVVFHDGSASINKLCEALGTVGKSSVVLSTDHGGQAEKYTSKTVKRIRDCKPKDTDRQYDHVVLGGTFDRLHNGHKELLSQAIIRCTSKLTVGVTHASMTKSKILHELIEPCEVRMKKVEEFLKDVDDSLEYNVVPIHDPFGPTKDDPTMNMIVVSAETLRGGQKVNELRREKNLSELEIHCVELVEDLLPPQLRDSEGEEWKISSSSGRIRLLGTTLRGPQQRSDIPSKPYVIGLTGGIASGKSAIGDRLERLGAGVINCDLLGHEIYLPGTKAHALILQHFGPKILDSEKKIDRKALAAIVFSDPKQLDFLNSLVWPLMMEEIEKKLSAMEEKGISVAVIEAAVLTRAGWDARCHEIWSVIVAPNEAIARLQERNGLSQEEAKRRLEAQPSNEEHVARANVVFSPSWSPDHTSQQVQRAWKELQTRLGAQSYLPGNL